MPVSSLLNPLTTRSMFSQLIVLGLASYSCCMPTTLVPHKWGEQKASFQEAVNSLRSGLAIAKAEDPAGGNKGWEYSSKSRQFENALEQVRK